MDFNFHVQNSVLPSEQCSVNVLFSTPQTPAKSSNWVSENSRKMQSQELLIPGLFVTVSRSNYRN